MWFFWRSQRKDLNADVLLFFFSPSSLSRTPCSIALSGESVLFWTPSTWIITTFDANNDRLHLLISLYFQVIVKGKMSRFKEENSHSMMWQWVHCETLEILPIRWGWPGITTPWTAQGWAGCEIMQSMNQRTMTCCLRGIGEGTWRSSLTVPFSTLVTPGMKLRVQNELLDLKKEKNKWHKIKWSRPAGRILTLTWIPKWFNSI